MENPWLSAPVCDTFAWDAARRLLRVQVFGANRIVGQELVQELLRAGHPVNGLELYGRRPRNLCWKGAALEVRPIGGELPRGDLAFLCTPPDVTRELIPILAARGTRVLDLSGGHGADDGTPLMLESINGAEIGAFTESIALPHRSAALIAPPLWALEQAAGLNEVDVVALVSAAGEGSRGILDLRAELETSLGELDPHRRRMANLRPAAGASGWDDVAAVELAIDRDVKRLLARPDLALDVSAYETDLERCDAFVIKAHTRSVLEPDDAARIFAGLPIIEVDASPGGPVAAACEGSDRIHVGRIRAGSRGPGSLCFFAVGDQLRAGAALAALRLASRIPAVG